MLANERPKCMIYCCQQSIFFRGANLPSDGLFGPHSFYLTQLLQQKHSAISTLSFSFMSKLKVSIPCFLFYPPLVCNFRKLKNEKMKNHGHKRDGRVQSEVREKS